jgi:nitrate reductase beta subunit
MLWNNVETKPYGFYPLAWDLKLLEKLGPQTWEDGTYEGRTLFEAAEAGERVLGWRPDEIDYAHPNVGEDDCTGTVDGGAALDLPHANWFFYLARICNHCTYPGCLASCPRGSIYKREEDGIVLVDQERCRGYQECVKGCPYKKMFFNPMTGTSEKCIACFPKFEMGLQPQCFVNCIGKIRFAGHISTPENAREDNPIDYLVHVRKLALPLFPQWGLEPNVYYVPPIHVPRPYLRQMFGPGVDRAIERYANPDRELLAVLQLFRRSNKIIFRYEIEPGPKVYEAGVGGRAVELYNDTVIAFGKNGKELFRTTIEEPLHVRPAQHANSI